MVEKIAVKNKDEVTIVFKDGTEKRIIKDSADVALRIYVLGGFCKMVIVQ